MEPILLWVTSIRFAVGVLIMALIAFHIIWVWRFPLSKVGWKYADYFWLGFSILGLIGAAHQSRETANRAYVAFFDGFESSDQTFLQSANRFREAFCTEAVNKEFSKDPKCQWFGGILQQVQPPDASRPIVIPPPPPHSPEAQEWTGVFETDAGFHNRWARTRAEILRPEPRAIYEDVFSMSAPVLLALALAIRITKVTGEILIENKHMPETE